MEIATAETVTVNGTVYNVIDSETPDQSYAAGRPHLAAHMMQRKQARILTIQKPAGRIAYSTVQYTNGSFSRVVSLGFGWRA